MMNISILDPDALGVIPAEELALRQWVADWYDRALTDGHIQLTYELDEPMAERLEAYFKVGLTPDDGVDALFGTLH